MEDQPFDGWDIQLPGRLWTVEILLSLLLRQTSNAGDIFTAADDVLAQLETHLHAEPDDFNQDRVTKIFAMARTSLDNLRVQALT